MQTHVTSLSQGEPISFAFVRTSEQTQANCFSDLNNINPHEFSVDSEPITNGVLLYQCHCLARYANYHVLIGVVITYTVQGRRTVRVQTALTRREI